MKHTPAKVAVVDGDGILPDAKTRADVDPSAQTTVMRDLALLLLWPLLAGSGHRLGAEARNCLCAVCTGRNALAWLQGFNDFCNSCGARTEVIECFLLGLVKHVDVRFDGEPSQVPRLTWHSIWRGKTAASGGGSLSAPVPALLRAGQLRKGICMCFLYVQ